MRRKILIATALLIFTCGWFLYDHFIEDGNFDIIQPNTLYRSATLSHHEWKEILREHPFKSVLNLRGVPHNLKKEEWYQREMDASKTSGINFYTLGLSANHQPDLATTGMLVEMMRSAPKPLLIHCKQGADRTGLAVALYEYAIMGKPAPEARKQLSLYYGHFPWLTSRTGAMERAFDAYVTANPQPAKPAATL